MVVILCSYGFPVYGTVNLIQDMKNSSTAFLLFVSLIVFAACERKPKKDDSMQRAADSVLKKQAMAASPPAGGTQPKDTTLFAGFPAVADGDIIFGTTTDPMAEKMGEVVPGAKFNNVGILFHLGKSNSYVVVGMGDSLMSSSVNDWLKHAAGHTIALMRLKNADTILNARSIMGFKKTLRGVRKKRGDDYFSWNDEAFYPSEFVWKAFHYGLNIDLCTPRKVSQLHNKALVQKLKMKYSNTIPASELFVSPDDIYHSDQLEQVYSK